MIARVVLLAAIFWGCCSSSNAMAVPESQCTAHKFWGKMYFHDWVTDESTWERPPGCLAMPKEETHFEEHRMVHVEHSLESSKLKFIQAIHKAWEPVPPHAITLTVQADFNRIKLGALNRIAKQWNGPVSAAVLTTNLDELVQYMSNGATAATKNWADVHAVVATEKWKHYPINKMRNFAIRPARTEFVFVIDIDEDLPFTMAQHLEQVLKISPDSYQRAAFVLTSWQWSFEYPPQTIPRSQVELAELFSKGKAAVKHPEYTPAYGVPGVDFWKWNSLNGLQEVEYRDAFEPYFITRKSNMPLFDERFHGFGGNKAIHTLRLALEGYHFVLLPKVFTWCREAPSTSAKHSPPPNPNLSGDAWWELGHAHGCDRCCPDCCVLNCPNLFNKHIRSSASIAPAIAGPPLPPPTIPPPASESVPSSVIATPSMTEAKEQQEKQQKEQQLQEQQQEQQRQQQAQAQAQAQAQQPPVMIPASDLNKEATNTNTGSNEKISAMTEPSTKASQPASMPMPMANVNLSSKNNRPEGVAVKQLVADNTSNMLANAPVPQANALPLVLPAPAPEAHQLQAQPPSQPQQQMQATTPGTNQPSQMIESTTATATATAMGTAISAAEMEENKQVSSPASPMPLTMDNTSPTTSTITLKSDKMGDPAPSALQPL